MKEHPILFSGPMVRAILDGRKTQTRRIVKPQPIYIIESHCRTYEPALVDRHGEIYPGPEVFGFYNEEHGWKCPYGKPGDRLWVQENYRLKLSDERWVNYPVSGEAWQRWTNPTESDLEKLAKRKRHVGLNTPGRFMYRSLSRIMLEIVSVRVERLQDITESDAIAEGIERDARGYLDYDWENKRGASTARGWFDNPVPSYRSLWEIINGPGSWLANPWVCVVEFNRVESEVAA